MVILLKENDLKIFFPCLPYTDIYLSLKPNPLIALQFNQLRRTL